MEGERPPGELSLSGQGCADGVVPVDAIDTATQSLWEAGRPLRFRDGNWSVQGPRPESGPGSQSYPSSPPLSLALAQRREGRLLPGCSGGCSAEAWVRSACGLLSSPAQLWSLPTAQNNMFKTGAEEWVLLNVNVTGYYQVNYDENNWRKIQNQLQIRPLVGTCHPTHPLPKAQPHDGAPDCRACPHRQPEVTRSVAPSRPSLSSIGHRSSTTASTWPGECSATEAWRLGECSSIVRASAACRRPHRVPGSAPWAPCACAHPSLGPMSPEIVSITAHTSQRRTLRFRA